MKYIIEHLEPKVFDWCLMEYKHISKIVGKQNLMVTNVKAKEVSKLKEFADVRTESVKDLQLKNIGILDPDAPKTLAASDKFDYLVFGGILGDYPPRMRTKIELVVPGAERRNLGKEQFPTDNAVYVAKEIASGKKMSDLKFQDGLTIETGPNEAVDLPFRYVLVNGKPLICKELIEHLKKGEEF
jgi:ribosome biogenesis SPOUT family RNA methylase Rps3